jgi:hypothetical protein
MSTSQSPKKKRVVTNRLSREDIKILDNVPIPDGVGRNGKESKVIFNFKSMAKGQCMELPLRNRPSALASLRTFLATKEGKLREFVHAADRDKFRIWREL